MALTGSTIASTYLKLLRINTDTMGADATASYIQDSADTDSALSISTTRVGIGTAAPAEVLHIYNSDACIRLENSGSTGIAEIYTNNQAGLIFDADPDNGDNGTPIIFKVDGTEEVRILSGGGLTFNGDTAAANALDDYEEGTWDAVVTDGTYPMTMLGTHDTGYYTKVGNLVTISGYFYTSSLGSCSGELRITGLPFTIADATAALGGGHVGTADNLAITAGHTVSYNFPQNQTFIQLFVWDATSGPSSMLTSEWSANSAAGGIMMSGSYRAA